MIDNLKPYPRMKDSGVPLLGRVPDHWEVPRLKNVVDRSRPLTYGIVQCGEHVPDGVPYVRPVDMRDDGTVKVGALKRTAESIAASYRRSALRCGDVVLSIGPSFGKVMIVPAELEGANLTQGTARLAPCKGVTSSYLFWMLRSRPLFESLASVATGSTFLALNLEPLARTRGVLPPVAEQDAIVRFLDHADRRIRRYIRAKQKLIKLLEEQKQALIHRAVTRGLDPNVRLKPSGVEWLGDVPEHWEVLPLKRLGWFKSGAGFPIGEQGNTGAEIPFLRVSDMTVAGNETWIEAADSTVSRETAQRLGAFVFPAGSIIFPKVGGALLTNKRRLLRRPSCIDNNVMGCVVRRGDLDFVYALFQQLDLGRLAKPGPVPAIGEGDVKEIKVALPPTSEQTAITAAVHANTTSYDAAISTANREVELLREYRTRLIADVVTGKLDVREAAALLPDELEDPEQLDELDAEDDAEETGDENAAEEAAQAEA